MKLSNNSVVHDRIHFSVLSNHIGLNVGKRENSH